MKLTLHALRGIVSLAALLLAGGVSAQTVRTNNGRYEIDLPAALQLAGAQNLEVRIARERLAQAKAEHQSAVAQFFPWISPGITYHQRDGLAQAVPAGTISDTDYYSYAPGATVGVRLELGEALYKSLAAKQTAAAAGHGVAAHLQETVFTAAQRYFELALAQSAVGVANEAVRISSSYATQLESAVAAGIAFKGELLRVRGQTERNRLALQQAKEHLRVAGADLAQVLQLDPTVELAVRETDLAPLALIKTNAALDSLVAQALASRPELKQSAALASAAREAQNGATYGPLIPTVSAQGFWGGLGGGRQDRPGTFGGQQDYLVGATWRIGPGGLFDVARRRSSKAQLQIAELTFSRIKEEVAKQVVQAFTRWSSLGQQLAIAQSSLAAADEGLRLARQRQGFAVGEVLETTLAEEELTRARLDLLNTIADFNKAQYALLRAIGEI